MNHHIGEAWDVSKASLFLASDGELIAEGKAAVMFMGSISFGIKNVVAHVGRENLDEGDVFVARLQLLCRFAPPPHANLPSYS